MGRYLLCKRKTAEIPFHIASVSLNLYSVEELSYFIVNYLPLAEEMITDENLPRWLEDECSMPGTADIIRSILIGPEERKYEALKVILKNGYYYSPSRLERISEQIDSFRDKSPSDKRMMRADILMRSRRYQSALEDYEKILADPENETAGDAFLGKLYYNLGCANVRIFHLPQARRYFGLALERIPGERVRAACMAAAYLEGGERMFTEEADRIRAAYGERNKVLARINSFEGPDITEDLGHLAEGWIRDYHESMGL